MRLYRIHAVGEAPSALAQPVSNSISSICQLLKISLALSTGLVCCMLLSRHAFCFFIEINDNSVIIYNLRVPSWCLQDADVVVILLLVPEFSEERDISGYGIVTPSWRQTYKSL